MNHILNRYLPFLMKSPLFCRFWTLFGHFLGTFPVRSVSMIPWQLNWIIFWIESAELFFELNDILNWILGRAILNWILNESFFGRIQTLNWIRLNRRPLQRCKVWAPYVYRARVLKFRDNCECCPAHHLGHSGEYSNAAKLAGKMSKSVMQLISIHFWNWF